LHKLLIALSTATTSIELKIVSGVLLSDGGEELGEGEGRGATQGRERGGRAGGNGSGRGSPNRVTPRVLNLSPPSK
jgi:hypothetical protein